MKPETDLELPWEGAEAPLQDYPIDTELVERLLTKMSWLKGQEVAQKNAQKAQATRLQNRIAWVMFGIAPVLDAFIKNTIAKAGQGKKTPVRSIPLNGGRIALRQVPEKFAVTAPDKVVEWAQKNDPENKTGIRRVELDYERARILVDQAILEMFELPDGPAGETEEELEKRTAKFIDDCLLGMDVAYQVPNPEAVKQYVKSVGEVPDGVTYEPAHDISILDFGKGLGTYRVEGWVLTQEDEAGSDE